MMRETEESTEGSERGIPKDEGTKGGGQDENKEEAMEDRTGIDRARRLETKADTQEDKRNRKRMRTEDKRGNRRETKDIENSGGTNGRDRVCAEKDDE
jgi:hypothetical protein